MTGEARYRPPQPGLPRDVLPRLARYAFTPASPRTRRARLDATTASIFWLSVVSGAGGIRTLVPRLRRRAAFSEVVPVPPRRLSVVSLGSRDVSGGLPVGSLPPSQ